MQLNMPADFIDKKVKIIAIQVVLDQRLNIIQQLLKRQSIHGMGVRLPQSGITRYYKLYKELLY